MKQRAHVSFLAIINISTIIFTTTMICQDPIQTVNEQLKALTREQKEKKSINLAGFENSPQNELYKATLFCKDTETSNTLYHSARRLAFHLARSPKEDPRRQEAQTEYDKAMTQFGKCIEPPFRF